MKHLSTLSSAAAAGICIAVGGSVFLGTDIKVAGALLFTVGLYIICTQGLNLFTGKVGYLAVQSSDAVGPYLLFLLEVWIGNFIGTYAMGTALRFSRIGGALGEKAAALCSVKLADSPFSLLILGILCGMLMYAAVDGYKKTQNPLVLFACVAGFILAGFEHCVADMFYFAAAGMLNLSVLWTLLVITFGNTLGGVLLPLIVKLQKA